MKRKPLSPLERILLLTLLIVVIGCAVLQFWDGRAFVW